MRGNDPLDSPRAPSATWADPAELDGHERVLQIAQILGRAFRRNRLAALGRSEAPCRKPISGKENNA